MKLLSIETSCDETAAAIIHKDPTDSFTTILSNVLSTSLGLHAKTGGIIPEIAAREQLKFIIPVIKKALEDTNSSEKDIDAIAVTIGPGLIGSLLVGVETAKALAFAWNKPLIPVNHLYGHIYANWINQKEPIEFPAIALIVSGGHTDLVLMKNHQDIQWLGGTRDDAAGEAFDKVGRLLNLPYPAGPAIEKNAQQGNVKAFNLPRPIINSDDFDFSFSGLKTAALREVQKIQTLDEKTTNDLCASLQQAIIDVLIKKTIKAVQKYDAKSVLLGGGVAANQTLKQQLESTILNLKSNIRLFVPPKSLCTDNAAMIGAAGAFNYIEKSWREIDANPELYFD